MILFGFFFANSILLAGMFTLTVVFYTLLKNVETSKLKDKELPFVTILVPARNEETKIGRCLDSLIAQDYPNFEIVVIDDRSADRTGEIIEEYAAKDERIKYVRGKDAPSGWIG